MSTTPEIPRMVTREMIEAHYKSVMKTALTLLSQDCVALAQNVLSDACRLPYPIPAPATMPKVDDQTDLAAFARAYLAMREAQKAYFKTRSHEDLIASKQAEKALDKAAALAVGKATGSAA